MHLGLEWVSVAFCQPGKEDEVMKTFKSSRGLKFIRLKTIR